MTRGTFTTEQIETLLRPIKASRVQTLRGMSHVEGYDVLAHLTRIFGFSGWDKEIEGPHLIFEDKEHQEERQETKVRKIYYRPARTVWNVAYRCQVRLTLFDHAGLVVTVHEDAAVGSATNQPNRADAHDLAMNSSITDAVKRAAKDLGDQFGLSLYDKGSTEPLVKRIVGHKTEGTEDGD